MRYCWRGVGLSCPQTSSIQNGQCSLAKMCDSLANRKVPQGWSAALCQNVLEGHKGMRQFHLFGAEAEANWYSHLSRLESGLKELSSKALSIFSKYSWPLAISSSSPWESVTLMRAHLSILSHFYSRSEEYQDGPDQDPPKP